MSLDPFIPVKITDRVWAERLLDGEIFMRSLHSFGSWSVVEQNQSEPVKNSYRGDLHEGAVAIYKDARDHSFIKDSDPEFQGIIHHITDIDADDLQYFKIFSLYAMRYDHKNNHFFLPDRRMKSFGDTAIIISDMDCFLRRILQRILKEHGELVQFLLDLVQYFDYQESTKLYPMFSKQQRYDYQNELRVAIGLLEPNKYSMDFSNSLIRSTEPLKLDIGDIRDIALALSIDDFLKLKFPSNISLRFPMSKSIKPSMLDMIVQDTRRVLEHRISPTVKPTITIW